jgi:hypothetical protein
LDNRDISLCLGCWEKNESEVVVAAFLSASVDEVMSYIINLSDSERAFLERDKPERFILTH